jgi:tetrahydromethanopterin S-methyltransferase subunit C
VSATSHGVASGIVIGICFVLLAQQFSYLDLSSLTTAIVDLVIAMVIGAAIFGVIGMALGRAYLRRHPSQPKEWKPPS